MIYHVISSEDWDASEDPYIPSGFSKDGFVHCLYPWQVERFVKVRFPDSGHILALELDYRAFPADEVKSENHSKLGEAFPHLFAPISRAAVRQVHKVTYDEGRDVRFPPAHPLFDGLSSTLHIRHALGRDDTMTLARLRCLMFVELHPEQVTEADYPDFLGKTEAYYSRHTFDEHHACFVLCAGDMVAGCGTLIVRENPPRPTRVPNRSGYVRDVYILPEHRGNGGAHLIMAMIREEAARRRIWELGLHASDMGLPIYTSKGYKPNSSYLELGDV